VAREGREETWWCAWGAQAACGGGGAVWVPAAAACASRSGRAVFVRLAVLLGGNDRTSCRPNGRFPPGLD